MKAQGLSTRIQAAPPHHGEGAGLVGRAVHQLVGNASLVAVAGDGLAVAVVGGAGDGAAGARAAGAFTIPRSPLTFRTFLEGGYSNVRGY